jgi:2-polyprenyl-3-methyl-5-hydroxy-6-metoxy-1,4-benzoquinol methylase
MKKEVKLLKQEGFNLQVLDVTKNTLLQKFDLVVCGEIIEHVGNPLALFENVCKMLKDDGIFVLSTPNPWYANVVLKNTFRSLPFTESADHVAWFDSGTLCELASRSGLQLDKYSGVKANRTSTIRSKLFFLFSPLLIKIGIKQEFFAKTIVYEFSRTLK